MVSGCVNHKSSDKPETWQKRDNATVTIKLCSVSLWTVGCAIGLRRGSNWEAILCHVIWNDYVKLYRMLSFLNKLNCKFAQYEYNLANANRTGTLDSVMKILYIRQLGYVPSDRPVYGGGLRLLACWDCGFDSRLGNGCLFLVRVVCWRVDVSATGQSLIQRSPTKCGASDCHFEASIMTKPRPTRGCCARKENGAHLSTIEKSYIYKKTKEDSQVIITRLFLMRYLTSSRKTQP
jgi:hypothetical protein